MSYTKTCSSREWGSVNSSPLPEVTRQDCCSNAVGDSIGFEGEDFREGLYYGRIGIPLFKLVSL